MADTPMTIPSDPDKGVKLDSEASGPTLMSLPAETLNQILGYVLPDKDVLRLSRGWYGRIDEDHSREEITAKDAATTSYCSYTGEADVLYQRSCSWMYDDEFRHNKEEVQTAILRVNRYLYEVGSRLLYERTLKVDIWALRGFGLYDRRFLYVRLRDFPWAKMRKVVLMVHAPMFMLDVELVREQLLILCGFLVSSDATVIKKLNVIFTGEWDPDKKIIPQECRFTFEGPTQPLYGRSDLTHTYEDNPRPWTISEAENLSMMLQPLRQLKRVQECEIQLPPSVQDDQRLADKVHRCIRDMKDKEQVVEAKELLEDWNKYLSMCKKLVEWEKEDDEFWSKWPERERQPRPAIDVSGPNDKLDVLDGDCISIG